MSNHTPAAIRAKDKERKAQERHPKANQELEKGSLAIRRQTHLEGVWDHICDPWSSTVSTQLRALIGRPR
jgi:hypothetical protein